MNPRSRPVQLTFRVLAMGLGLVPLLGVELVLSILNIPDEKAPSSLLDEFIAVRPLFVLDPESDRMEVADNRLEYFQTDSFARVKRSSERRIFVLGGSTVQGRPYGHATAFSSWLEQSLRAGDPKYQWQVVNCGGVSYASYRLAVVLAEVLRYQPDLVILYTGNNEYLERRSLPASLDSGPLNWWLRRGFQLRTTRALSHLIAGRNLLGDPSVASHKTKVLNGVTFPPPAKDIDRQPSPSESDLNLREVHALLDRPDGIDEYSAHSTLDEHVTASFRRNLHGMIQQCGDADVPLVLISPAVNLADCPPFKSSGDLPASVDLETSSLADRMKVLHTERERQPQSATIAFRLASVQNELGLTKEAEVHFQAACDLDRVPLRATSAIRHVISQSAQQFNIPLIDAHELLALKSRGGILGRRWMVDHVHPGIAGHQQIALAVASKLEDIHLVALAPSWQDDAQVAFKTHLLELDETYYARGNARLKALEAWARGRNQSKQSP